MTTIEIDTLDSMNYDVGTGEHTQEITATNLVQYLGATTACGEFSYTLQNEPDFLSLSGNTLTVASGTYEE